MKKVFLLCLYLGCVVFSYSQPIVNIIPVPSKVILEDGLLKLTSDFSIIDEKKRFESEISIFHENIKSVLPLSFSNKNGKKKIKLIYDSQLGHPEAYQLVISAKGIIVKGNETGIFYGLQSLFQLIVANTNPKTGTTILPLVSIEDAPRYSWRGMHLDVCRHFFTKEEVKKYIDYLALHKLNTFHWHLTEDQGWRIEIKKYPLLTSIGSYRSGTIIGPFSPSAVSDHIPHQGYYSQQDIRDVVAYASARHITIVPEIEMPGHALAALSAYPEYSCTGGPFAPAITWGVFDDVFCAGNEATYSFLENILGEVIPLFPGKYLHIGGDECPKTRWETCAKCQQKMKDNGLANEHALQSYFITRIEKFVNSQGKQIIGWDEILEGGLAPNAAVMSWRGSAGGIAAAQQGHAVVMSPGQPCYFDHYQVKETKTEPLAIGGYNSLEAVYTYKPTPEELTAEQAKYVLGAQGNVWTEYIPTFSQVEYMALPRMCALSETLWSSPDKKEFREFLERLKKHTQLLDAKKINYAKHFLK